MILYRALLAIDLVAGAVLLLFFGWGVADGSANHAPGTWLVLLAVTGGTIAGAIMLKRRGHLWGGVVLLLVVAVPAIFLGLFLALAMTMAPDWR